jgi:hypothetical protein
MQKIDDCKEIRLSLTRAGIATRFEKCVKTFRLVVTAQYDYQSDVIHTDLAGLMPPTISGYKYVSHSSTAALVSSILTY